jgi:hypothetical protein
MLCNVEPKLEVFIRPAVKKNIVQLRDWDDNQYEKRVN